MARALWFALLMALCCPAAAKEAAPAAADPALEKRVNRLAEELRCLVCQNQTLADSHADLAVDLKNQVREQLRQGRSEDDVIRYMTERYGDFVLYRPPVKGSTVFLWFGPALLVAGGLGGLVYYLRQRRRMTVEDDPGDGLSDDDWSAAPSRSSPHP